MAEVSMKPTARIARKAMQKRFKEFILDFELVDEAAGTKTE